ncbi:MAG: response regulator [Elusimicrobia bacterium]|nr:response regulator [Elusimicrobiota bacterium]
MAKILIIDDDGIVRDALSVFLTRAGHRVLTAADGANGVLAFKNNMPDLVVLDRDLPVMSGSKVFDNIRKISTTTPVIILSGFNDPEEVEAYLRHGAAAFLSKGDGLAPVLEEIDRLLGAQSKEDFAGLKAGKPAEGPAADTRAGAVSKPCPPCCIGGASGPQTANAASGRAAALVLLADDDPAIRAVLRRFLASLSCEVLEAEDGAAALELARARKPDIVLLDISMPKKTGVEALKELLPEMPGTGFMMISGNDDEETARECLRLGAFDYVSKPINLAALGELIKARLFLQKP